MSKPGDVFEELFERWMSIWALFILAGVALVAIIAAVAFVLPVALAIGAVLGVGFALYWYNTSPTLVMRRHQKEVIDLLATAEHQQKQLATSIEDAVALRVGLTEPPLSDGLATGIVAIAEELYQREFLRALPPLPPVPVHAEKVYDFDYDRRTLKKGEEPPHRERRDSSGRPTSAELERFKLLVRRFVVATQDPAAIADQFADTLIEVARTIEAALPPIAASTAMLSVPLIDLVANPKALLARSLRAFSRSEVARSLHFATVRDAIERNRKRASASHLRERDLAEGHVLDPEKFPGSPREALDAYLPGTGLERLFLTPLPFSIPQAKRFEGHWVVARQGSGKTNALECLIAADLDEVAEGRASVMVMDSQGVASDTLLGRLSTLKLFAPGQPLAGRLIYLEPDLDFPLALNLFDIGLSAMGRLTTAQREDIVSSACEVVEFMFTALLSGELSDNMTMLYKYVVPAMLVIPDADMNTFIDLLDTETGRGTGPPAGYQKYSEHFSRLEPEIASFLETDFLKDPELVKTKAAVRRRLRAAMADATFRRMFMQPRNRLNLFKELQSAKVILVNTYPAKTYVEQFGRLILALLMQATRQRLEIDRHHRMPTYVYVDECQDYIAKEERIAKYIDKCRKQNVGLVLANQRLANIENPRVLSALSGVAIKFAGVSDADSSDLASLTQTSADHIRSLPRGTFSAYISGVTPQGVDLHFPLSPFEHASRITRAEWEAMRSAMRQRYAVRHDAGMPASDAASAAEQANGTARHETQTEAEAPKAGRSEERPPNSGTSAQSANAKRRNGAGADDYDPLQ